LISPFISRYSSGCGLLGSSTGEDLRPSSPRAIVENQKTMFWPLRWQSSAHLENQNRFSNIAAGVHPEDSRPGMEAGPYQGKRICRICYLDLRAASPKKTIPRLLLAVREPQKPGITRFFSFYNWPSEEGNDFRYRELTPPPVPKKSRIPRRGVRFSSPGGRRRSGRSPANKLLAGPSTKADWWRAIGEA